MENLHIAMEISTKDSFKAIKNLEKVSIIIVQETVMKAVLKRI